LNAEYLEATRMNIRAHAQETKATGEDMTDLVNFIVEIKKIPK
jgi:hypothetical protein